MTPETPEVYKIIQGVLKCAYSCNTAQRPNTLSALLTQFSVTKNRASSTLLYPDCLSIPHCSQSLALHLLVAMNWNTLWWVKYPPDHEITVLVTRNRRAINFQIYGYKTSFYFPPPSPRSTSFFFLILKLEKISLEEIVASRQHLYSGKVTFILFILSKLTAGIVNSMVYLTIVFLSSRWGLQIFIKGGLTDFKVDVFYCRQDSSLRQVAGVWGTLFLVSVFAGRIISRPGLCGFWGAAWSG